MQIVCILSADATASQNHVISCLIYIQTGFTFLVSAYPGCPGKKPLNGCSSSSCYCCQDISIFDAGLHRDRCWTRAADRV